MIYNNMVFNDETINIFTDASIKVTQDKHTIGSAGFCIYNGKEILKIDTNIIYDTTNNHSEINAIRSGILEALKYNGSGKTINLFSDSKICIFGLRQWIFNWVNCVKNGILYGSMGTAVSNQDVILDIIYMIINNNLNINLYHQSGHVCVCNNKSLESAKTIFMHTNNITHDVDMELIKNISTANNIIDNFTRDYLVKYLEGDSDYQKYEFINPISFHYNGIDIPKYKQLLNIRE